MANKKINQLDVRTSPSLTDLLAIADPSSGYAYKITGTSLQSLLDVTNRVPYTGATASVNLGEFGLTAGQLTLDTTPTGTAVVGTTQWNDTIGSSQTLLKGGNVLLKNGVDLVARVVNKVSPATTLTKAAYKAVRVSGAQGQRLAIAYAQANNDNNSADTIGLVCETIAANQEGFIITVGQLLEVNTTGSLQGETWADGDVLYLSPTTAGNITNVKPNGSNGHIVVIGYVEYAHAVHGSIYVKTMNGWELDELHNVYINTPANNEVLTYESSTSLWKNKSISTILGYTPQAAITLTTTGSSGVATFVSNTLNIPTVTLAGLGGASDSLVMHLAGTETATGVKTFSIGLATTTGDNFLNTSSGNLLVGYSATPATNTYKLNVNGGGYFAGDITAISSATSIILKGTTTNVGTKGIYFYNNNLSGWVRSVPSGGSDTGNLELGAFGSNFMTTSGSVLGVTKASMFVPLEGSEFMGNSVNSGTHYYSFNNAEKAVRIVSTRLGSFGRGDFKILVRTALSSTDAADSDAAIYIPGSNRNVSINNGASDMGYALGVNGTFKATGVLQLSSYTTTSSVPGTVAGLLGFDSSGNIITTSSSGGGISGSGTAGQVTYWSGTSAVTGSATLTYTPTTALLVNNSVTASSAIARGLNFTPTLTAAANNDVLVGLDVNPTFTNGAFTGLKNYALRTSGPLYISNTTALTSSPFSIEMNPSGTGTNNSVGIEFRNTNATSNKVQFILGGGTIASGYSRIWSFGVDLNGTGVKDFSIYNGNTSKLPFIITANENFILGNQTTNTNYTDSGYRLDINGTGATAGALRVTGTMTITGGSSFGGNMILTFNQNSNTSFTVLNGNNNANTRSTINIQSALGTLALEKWSPSTTAYKFITASDAIIYNGTAGDISILNDVATGNIKLAAGASSTAHVTIKSNGRINMSSLPTSATGLSAGDLWNNLGVINIV